jgi:hypothetical protein
LKRFWTQESVLFSISLTGHQPFRGKQTGQGNALACVVSLSWQEGHGAGARRRMARTVESCQRRPG